MLHAQKFLFLICNRPRSHATKAQIDVLIDFMQQNPHFARNEQGGPNSFSKNESRWSEIANVLNQRGPPTKSVDQWKSVSEYVPTIYFNMLCTLYTFRFVHFIESNFISPSNRCIHV